MAGGRLKRLLQYCYLAAALIYAAVVFFWGRYDMARINREYRLVSTRLAGDYAMVTAGHEVAAGCRQAAGGIDAAGYGDCLRSAEPLVARRAAVIGQELRSEKEQVVKKLLIFYSLLLLVLILLPVVFVYVMLATLIHICTGIRFDKDHSD
jgi:hypothetical protein